MGSINRINQTFASKDHILNIYFTAGFPETDDTLRIAGALEAAGADMLEIGIPFSDPIADGPTIQYSSKCSLERGMTIELLFEQLRSLRSKVSIPVLLMGYINPVLQFGLTRFCEECGKVGVDGVIIPDLPIEEFTEHYRACFKAKHVHNIFLIGPNTSEERIRVIDKETEGFIYVVSSVGITGAKINVQEGQLEYYQRIEQMKLKNPRLIGFGISNKETFDAACKNAEGAIIGSAFIDQLNRDASNDAIKKFVRSIK